MRRKGGQPEGNPVVGAIVLVILAGLVWYFWPTLAAWNAGRQARAAADEFLAELGKGRPGAARDLEAQPPAYEADELEAVARHLGLANFAAVSWDESTLNPERTACDLKGTARMQGGRELAVSLAVAYRDGRWGVTAVSSPELPADFWKEHALKAARETAEKVLAGEPDAERLKYLVGQPDAVAQGLRALQCFDVQATQWRQTTYDPGPKVCTLEGVAKLYDGRELPLTFQVRRTSYQWQVTALTCPQERSSLPKEYAVRQATAAAQAFLTAAARQFQPSGMGGPGGGGSGPPGGGAPGATGGGEAAAPGDRGWVSWLAQGGEQNGADFPTRLQAVEALLGRVPFAGYQTARWDEAAYEPEALTCRLRGVATLTGGRTVPLTLLVRRERPDEDHGGNAWRIAQVSSP